MTIEKITINGVPVSDSHPIKECCKDNQGRTKTICSYLA
jgi:hypothetical protein